MTPIALRSLLFVPANVPKFVSKASTSAADVVVLDLEDGVAPDQKQSARGVVAEHARQASENGKPVFIRINSDLGNAVRDVESALSSHVRGIVVPKVEGPDHIVLLADYVAEIERQKQLPEGATEFILLIETAKAFLNIDEILRASPRIVSVAFGDEDFSAEIGCAPSSENMIAYKHQLVVSATRANVRALGLFSSIAEFRDMNAFRTGAERARAVGMKGSFCIHPAQVDVLNQTFSPSEQEIATAREVCDVFEEAVSNGAGAISFNGKMIDRPIYNQARAVLDCSGLSDHVRRGA
jgi:citrate lyase subunit beta/citryl-CoA lyase